MSATGSGLPGHGWPLVGRDAELTAITAALEPGGAGGVVLAGAPGVGRTRLAREALTRARRIAGDVGFVVATRAAASVPFAALSAVLTASCVPADGMPTEAERLELWRDAAEQMAARASGGRFILSVDDAHLLDEQSAALIHQLVVHGQVSVVATVQAGERAPEPVRALWKDGLARRLTVRPLTGAAVDELLGQVLGPHIDGRTRRQIHGATAGNPLLLRELLGGALEEAALVQSFGVWHWDKGPRYGASLVELVEGWLAVLGEAARMALEVIACGEPLAAAVLTDLTGRGVLEPAALAEVERRGVVVRERSGRREILRPAHPMYGEVIRAVLPSGDAQQIRRWLAGAVASGPLRRRDDVLRLVTCQLEAGVRPDRSVLAAAASDAAQRADLDLAERLLRTARDATARQTTARDAAARQDAGHALARVLTWQGRHAEAAAALPGPPPDGDAERRAAWVVTRAWNRYWTGSKLPEALAELDAATPGTAAGHADVAGTRAWLLLYSGECERALGAISAAAAGVSAGTAWPFPLAAAVLASALAGRTGTAIALSERDPDAAAAVWDGVMLRWPRCLALLLSGRTWEAQALAEAGYAAAVVHGTDCGMIAVWAACRGKVASAQGQFAAAETAFREAVALLGERDTYQFSRHVMAELAGVLAQAGDERAARDWMRRSDRRRTGANHMFEPWAELKRAWVIAAGGELARAAAQAARAAGLARAAGQQAVEAEALYDAVRLGHPAPARLADLAAALDGALAPVLAAAAGALASLDGHRLDEAAAAFDDLGLLVHAAEAEGAAVRAHRAHGRPAAASTAQRRLAVLTGACPQARTPLLKINGAETAAGLTRREREIALMASSGLSSKAIAAKLDLSVRTISNHLGSIYAKLGVPGRDELAARFHPAS